MNRIFCDKCKKELKDSDNYWKAWNKRRPFLDDMHICAKCMETFMSDTGSPSNPAVKED